MNLNQTPMLITGVCLAMYWARVLRMAAKTRRQTGNAANLFPTETLGRVLRVIWFPCVGLWIAAPFLAITTRGGLTAPLQVPLVLSWPAAVMVFSCLAASWVCWRQMGRSWRMGINPHEKTQLVVTGPYAYVRHPIYAISTAMAGASLLAVPSAIMLVAVLVHMALLQWESRREEQYLLSMHGEAYRLYCQTAGRFVPRLRRQTQT
jgi:protein-S-isoprenylcysteine O-methyltransferase Ste14